MPYIFLAESYNELGLLIIVTQKLEYIETPINEFSDDNFLLLEFERIKASASRDILIFGDHAHEYLNLHLRTVYDLIIRIISILRNLPESLLLNAREKYLYLHCTEFRLELDKLSSFYLDLKELTIK